MKRTLIVAVLALAPPAMAETLRCKSALIQTGATAGYVTEKCGVPDSKETITEPVRARGFTGTYQVGTTSREIWRYRRGSGKFPALLTFEEGVLKKLEFEK